MTARHEATGTQKVCGHAKLETTQVYAVSRTAILIASRLYSQPRRAVGQGAAGGGKGRVNFLYSLTLFLDCTIGIVACIGFPIVSTKFSLLRNYALFHNEF